MRPDCDLIVVGAGATGLYAARVAERAGLTVVVLDAADRVAGRVNTVETADGHVVDAGAQLLNGDMPRALALVAEGDASLARLPIGGADVLVVDGKARRLAASMSVLPRLAAAAERGDVPPCALDTWLDGLALDRTERLMAESEISEMYGQPTARLDARGACAAARSFASQRPEAEFQVVGGMEPVFAHLAASLSRAPLTGTAVRAIEAHADGVTVHTMQSALRAGHVLVAVSPPVAARIGFACPDAAAVRSALDSWIAGDLIKFHVFYARAFWRDAGLSGAAAIADTCGLSVLDTSLEAPRLTAFLGGTLARDWAARPLEQRERLLQDALVRAFGAEAGKPTAWHETVWIDHPWYGGAYHAHLRAGADPDAMRRLIERSGRIRFAAAELTHHFNGYLEGALCSGERALAGVCVRRGDSPEG